MQVLKLYCAVAAAMLSIASMPGFGADRTAGGNSLSSKDRQFISKAAQAGHAEVAAGKLAASQASSDEVKKFGQHMVDDHGKANEELARIAQAKGITPPAGPDAAHQRLATRLQAAKAAEFDRLYVSEAGVKDHKAAVALFTDQAKNGKDAELKAFAEKTLPTIKEHQKMAQDLARSAGKSR
ncbi:MAG TPA: DUF4142 domain-containing protein [Burkholderiales bacterium]|jgi:putative membrane protein|nr:DUF4142 domain-containing protein [Burkholderiales bacterium]